MNIRFTQYLLVIIFVFTALLSEAQQKKKIEFSGLDVINGLFYQPNTIAPYTGTAFEQHPNDKKKMEVPIKDGKPHGKITEWAPNGKKVYQAEYNMGTQINTEEQWYATGTKKLIVHYENGQPQGICTEWHKNGQKKSEGQFVNGKENGKHNWWYNDGSNDQIANYKNGVADGKIMQWHRNGKLRMEQTYRMGKKDGPQIEWYNNGNKKTEGNFENDKEAGTFLTWSKAGKLLAKQVFDAGKLIEDYNYRSGSVRTLEGFVQIFNGMESFCSIEVTGTGDKEVEDISEIVTTYIVDGMLLQFFTMPVAKFDAEMITDEQKLLEKYIANEKAYIEKEDSINIEVKQELMTTDDGKTMIYWHFDSPTKNDPKQKPRTVQTEHYISMLCNQEVLSIYTVVTNSDEATAPPTMIKRIAKNVTIAKERIDLNAIAHSAATLSD